MADDQQFRIHIVSDADNAGFKSAAAAQKELGDDTQVATERAREHGAAQREIFRVTSELNYIVPGLGEAMRAAFDPDSIGIVGAFLAAEVFRSVLEDIAALDKVQLANFTSDKEAIDGVREAYEKAAIAARIFLDEEIRRETAGLSAEEITKRRIENFKNLASAQEQFNSAQKKFSEAEIDSQEKQGVISHAQALKEKFALDVDYAKKKLQLEAQTAVQEVAAKERQLIVEKQQLASALNDQKADEQNAAASDASKVKHDKRVEAAKQNIADAQKALDELGKSHGTIIEGKINDETVEQLKEYYEQYVGDSSKVSLTDQFSQLQKKLQDWGSGASWSLGLTNFLNRTIGNQSGPAGLAKYEGAQQQIAGAKKELDQLSKSQFNVDLNAERGKKQLDATDESIRTLSKSVQDLAREIPQLKGDSAAKLNNDAATENLNLRTDAINKGLRDPGSIFRATADPTASPAPSLDLGPAGSTPARVPFEQTPEGIARRDFNQLESAHEILENGGKLNEQQPAYIEHVAELMRGHTVKSDQILGFMREVLATQKSRDTAFSSELESLKRQISHTSYNNH